MVIQRIDKLARIILHSIFVNIEFFAVSVINIIRDFHGASFDVDAGDRNRGGRKVVADFNGGFLGLFIDTGS